MKKRWRLWTASSRTNLAARKSSTTAASVWQKSIAPRKLSFDQSLAFAENFTGALFGKARLLVNLDRIDEARPVA